MVSSCAPDAPPPPPPSSISASADRAAIVAQVAAGAEATRNKDIDAYLDQIPDDVVMHDETGTVITREALRAQVRKAWATIERTRILDIVVDTVAVRGDSATVMTSMRWDRLVRRADGGGIDTIVSTKRQREVWRRTPKGWRSYEVRSLGGTTTVNGKVVDGDPGSPRGP